MTSSRMKRKKKLFNPDIISARLLKEVSRDLEIKTQLYCDPSVFNYVIENQKSVFLKKYFNPSMGQAHLVPDTFKKFEDVNKHMGTVFFQRPHRDFIQSSDPFLTKVLLRARSLLHQVVTPFTEEELFLACKHGPGSTLGVSFSDTSIEKKFSFPLSTTQRAKPLMDRYLSYDFELYEAIDVINCGSTEPMYTIVKGSRATTVPKSNTILRMIAVEPTVNMFFQQGYMVMLYERMARFGLDVETLPSFHRQYALEGSITRKLSTIDFSSASDCVSIELLRYLLPPQWFSALDTVRSEYMDLSGSYTKLNMFSTMGNAVTFPLESLIFWSLGVATIITQDGRSNSLFSTEKQRSKMSVFGDDCIIPTEYSEMFIQVCEKVGFIVNHDKSYFSSDEAFRESCGGDFLSGHNVRAFYLSAPTGVQASRLEPWLYTIMNNLLKKYMVYFGATNYIYRAGFLAYMSELFRENNLRLKIVPHDYPDDSGLLFTEDLSRILSNYTFDLDDLSINKHGTVRFRFLRFQYFKQVQVSENLRYWYQLKYQGHPEQFHSRFRKKRRIGGYTVGVGCSSHWGLLRDCIGHGKQR